MDSLETVSNGPWTGGWGEVTVVAYVLGDQVNGVLRRVTVVLLTLSLFLVQGEKPWCECVDLPLSWLLIGGLTTSVRSLSWRLAIRCLKASTVSLLRNNSAHSCTAFATASTCSVVR